jgi:electron transfer DM13
VTTGPILEARPPASGWRSRRRLITVVAIAVAVVGTGGLLWFQPQKLFIDETVNEAVPGASVMTDDTMSGSHGAMPDAMQRAMADDLSGTFSSLAHETKGRAVVREIADGSRVLRLEDFETSNGPDVRVYLSAGSKDAYGKDAVDLGGLKGNVGNQNYAVPSGTDLDRYDTVVIWCRRFTVAFGAAKLG